MKNKNYYFSFASVLFLIGFGILFLSPLKTNAYNNVGYCSGEIAFVDDLIGTINTTGALLIGSSTWNGSFEDNCNAEAYNTLRGVYYNAITGEYLGYTVSTDSAPANKTSTLGVLFASAFLNNSTTTFSTFPNIYLWLFENKYIPACGATTSTMAGCTAYVNANFATEPIIGGYSIGNNEGPLTGNESIIIRFPGDGMEEIPDFKNWVLASNGLESTRTYYFSITAYLSSSTVSSSEVGTSFTDISSFTGSSSTASWAFPKSGLLTFGQNGVREWTITAKICGEQYCFVPLDTDEITITTLFPGTIPNNAYAELAGPFDTPDDYLYTKSGQKLTREAVDAWNKNNSIWCGDMPQSSVDIGGWTAWGLCRVFNFILHPSDVSIGFLEDNFLLIKQIYPMKYVFDWVDEARLTTEDTSDNSIPSLTIDFAEAFDADIDPLILLSSSSLSTLIGSSTKSSIFTVERYLISLTVLAIVATTVLL